MTDSETSLFGRLLWRRGPLVLRAWWMAMVGMGLWALAACSGGAAEEVAAGRAMYYWRTEWRLDSVERAFLRQHDVGTLYVRYFDVTLREDGRVMPNATLRFADSVPRDIEVVPTVFMTENCLRARLDSVAERLVARVVQMNETHGVKGVSEMQIDCDYTKRSRAAYYAFLHQLRAAARQHGMRLSATIRLHQLSMDAPPVDYGVLMVYNTGDVRHPRGHNPLLDARDVRPYLRHLAAYPLPLCAAYPIFTWQSVYDQQGFRSLLYGRPAAADYVVEAPTRLPAPTRGAGDVVLQPGDTVKLWRVEAEELQRIERMVGQERPGINRRIILYHLDNQQIKNYKTTDYEKIFNP